MFRDSNWRVVTKGTETIIIVHWGYITSSSSHHNTRQVIITGVFSPERLVPPPSGTTRSQSAIPSVSLLDETLSHPHSSSGRSFMRNVRFLFDFLEHIKRGQENPFIIHAVRDPSRASLLEIIHQENNEITTGMTLLKFKNPFSLSWLPFLYGRRRGSHANTLGRLFSWMGHLTKTMISGSTQ